MTPGLAASTTSKPNHKPFKSANLFPDGRSGGAGNLTLLPLPPYAPELNPVETAWEYLRGNQLSKAVWNRHEQIGAALGSKHTKSFRIKPAAEALTPAWRTMFSQAW